MTGTCLFSNLPIPQKVVISVIRFIFKTDKLRKTSQLHSDGTENTKKKK